MSQSLQEHMKHSYSYLFLHPCRADTTMQLLLVDTRGDLIFVQSGSRLEFFVQYCSRKELLKCVYVEFTDLSGRREPACT